jgi:hypothetical protein
MNCWIFFSQKEKEFKEEKKHSKVVGIIHEDLFKLNVSFSKEIKTFEKRLLDTKQKKFMSFERNFLL